MRSWLLLRNGWTNRWRACGLTSRPCEPGGQRVHALVFCRGPTRVAVGRVSCSPSFARLPKILDRVVVECYGAETPLNQVASVKTTRYIIFLIW
ncbi:unnamed protein product [Ectocarpus sp. 13 AM-2016]